MAEYESSFAEEVYKNVDFGEEIKMCMQCGVCAASCPLSLKMDYPPRQIFALIRAGERDAVLNSQSILLCTSCYSCKVRCPRKIPVVDVMHGLAHYAIKKGSVSRELTASFGREFWNQVYKLGRVDEKELPRRVFFSQGLIEGIKSTMKFMDIGLKMVLHRRMKLLPEKKIKGIKDLRRMLDRAGEMGKGGGEA